MKIGKNFLSLLLMLLLLVPGVLVTGFSVKAVDLYWGCIGGVEYSATSDENYASTIGLCNGDHDGDGVLEHNVASGSITIPNTVKLGTVGNQVSYENFEVKWVDGFAHTDITEVIINGDLMGIAYGAFQYSSIENLVLKSVEVIGTRAFASSSLESITIRGEIKEIGEEAFAYTSLESINLPITLELIGKGAFRNTPIKSIIIPRKVKVIAERAFQSCENLTTAIITGDPGIDIGVHAFNSCKSLSNVSFDVIENIADYAFSYCDSLQEVNLKNVKTISDYAFSYSTIDKLIIGEKAVIAGDNNFSNSIIGNVVLCENANTYRGSFDWSTQIDTVTITEYYSDNISGLFMNSPLVPSAKIKSFLVDENNQSYSSIDGILFNKDKTELIKYPFAKGDKKYVIPDSVKTIKEYAFAFCDNLEQIKLPQGLECIEAEAFYSCGQLTEISIPNAVKEISIAAFLYNFSLTDAYYDGTEDEWQKIHFSNKKGYDTETVLVFYPEVTMHFNTVEPEEPEHTHSFTSGVIVDATCTENGAISIFCQCGYNYVDVIFAKSHKDENGDYKCDNEGCDYEFEKPVDPTPDEPTTPDTPSNPSDNCSCNCHKGGIAGFFFKIIIFFQRIFRTNKTCDCGIAHY